jgi:hypothetical protein
LTFFPEGLSFRAKFSSWVNIRMDLGETTNLVQKEPTMAGKLAGELSNYLRSMDAQMPIIKATGKQVPWPDEALEVKMIHPST